MSIEVFPWQVAKRDRLVEMFGSGCMFCLDASSTGTGKTFTAIDMLRKLNRQALVIAPKAVLSSWHAVARLMEAEHLLLDVINFEKLKTGGTRWFNSDAWCLPPNTILIIDEVQKGLSGPETIANKMVALTLAYKIPVLAMSATPADSPLKMRSLAYLAGLHRFSKSSFYDWALRNGCRRNKWNGVEFCKGPRAVAIMAAIGEQIKDKTVKITVDEAPGFPENQTNVEIFDLSKRETDEVNAIYAEMQDTLSKPHPNPLVVVLKARQAIEFQKVSLLQELAEDCVAEGNSAVVFVNFRNSITELEGRLKAKGLTVSVIQGVAGVKEQEARDQAILDFQSDKSQVALVSVAAGGAGLSLHSLGTARPRRTFITPSFSSTELRQLLGRCWRAGGNSKVIQTIVLVADSIEERVYRSVQGKIANLDALLDGDLDLTKG